MTRKPWADKGSGLYKTAAWLALRKRILNRDGYTCQMCGAMLRQGRSDAESTILRPAVIDHLIPHRGNPKAFFVSDLLWALCCDCHDGPCQSIEARGLPDASMLAAKLTHRVPAYDGTTRRPLNRWVDTKHNSARLMIW